MTFRVSRLAGACQPLSGAHMDLWQCNASGVYSGVSGPHFDTTGRKYLRGHQVADRDGIARFTTIYPGWYPGRTVHIHFRIRAPASGGRGEQFTSQLSCNDALSDRIFARAPYAGRRPRAARNSRSGGALVRKGSCSGGAAWVGLTHYEYAKHSSSFIAMVAPRRQANSNDESPLVGWSLYYAGIRVASYHGPADIEIPQSATAEVSVYGRREEGTLQIDSRCVHRKV